MPGYEQFYGIQPPDIQDGIGARFPWGISLAPNGGKVFYVCSAGPPDGATDLIRTNLSATLGEGLHKCLADRGDTVIILPGHAENVVDNTMLTNLVNGTRIIGVGQGSKMPAFTWTAAASQWVI